ncbi:uncharacterized protein EDB93DRAFT_1328152 [Suillus bovinus]|uniref:uncharacterized protein n=1 Tax=Suillus bovinus TaxID=48563 RepID=UPI001B86E096|nr:uncharacterized protein EDB93DRAFT_1328152 [Suillus bovinus]KAG2149040.1 hypothetical protein EDB93DRAFT_1328152 [Suillus bovinus]
MSSSESTAITSVVGFHDSKADTRRYATIIPYEIVEGMSFLSLDEEDADTDESLYTDFVSSWEFSAGPVANSKNSDLVLSEAQELVKKHKERSDEITEAQRVIQEYLQRNKTFDDQGTTDSVCPINTAKELPIIPNNRDSTYTYTLTDDGQSTIDLEKRPEPKIRLFHYDSEGVAQAQLQGLDIVQAGHYAPGAMIRCQRPGCTNVLRDLEALKFHLHIHNIGDMTDAISVLSAHTQRAKEPGHSSTESSPLNNSSRKVRGRSKSLMGADATHPSRKVHGKDPYSHSRSRKPTATHIKSNALHTRTKLPDGPQTRGRHSNRNTNRSGLDEASYHDSIAMVLSRPVSPVRGTQEALGSVMNTPVNFGNKSSVLSPSAGLTYAERELPRARSPKRAFSPARAFSPIRGMSFICILSVRPAKVLMSHRWSSTSAFIRMLE